ncbi:1-phosphofructokinase family hexose kinase [Undibacter mobilis]|uniref:Phosphofructokinase n=1 Tax=Undibacter mobilis TaxID=2292256 RepID=A0A371B7I3_9BRAD|nr:1-phosphofructokinase family hexose kinase [Undibacter mobilis]RDV03540.1 1-phosphofructokinase family hexose kinase [Undibacter mobilis]
MPDIVTITINPAVDIFVDVERVEPIRKMRCSAPKRDPGGGGINVARVAYRLGGDVTAIYPAGGAIGKLLQKLLDREGIVSIATPSHVETRENFTAFETTSGDQFRFVLPGSTLHRAEWEACLDKLTTLQGKPSFVVASGSIPPGVPEDFFSRVIREARKLGARTVVDTSGDALKEAIAEGVDIIKPNLNELSEFTGEKLDSDAACVAACRKLIDADRVTMVALTLGGDGALLVTKDRALKAQPMKIDVVSAVGAGDSFLGGLVWALAQGQSEHDAFRVAVAAGSAAVMNPGTELCREVEVKQLLPKVKIAEISL